MINRVAIVTGGARGIGRAISLRFARDGYTTCVFDRDAAGLEDLKNAAYADGLDIHTQPGDVSQFSQVGDWIDRCVRDHGRIDVVVANAGIMAVGAAADTTEEDWDRAIGINLKGYFAVAKHAIGHLKKSGGGSIINVASINAFWVEPQMAAYTASKGGIMSLTRSIAIDYGRDNIRCNSICPGYVDTGLTQEYFDAAEDPVAARTTAAALHPIGRLGEASEIAGMAAFLASEDASFCTGQSFVVDGGLSAGVVSQ